MRKIAIVGTSPQNAHLAPYNDPTWEIWGISRMYLMVPRWDRWYELHRFEELCRTWAPGQDDVEAESRKAYTQWLTQDHGRPIFVQPPLAGQGPSLVPYPLEQVIQAFPRRYFTNQISYMIAHAILELETEETPALGVWGVDMALKEEYREQRPSCEYFLGIAEGRGIEVVIPEQSNLLRCSGLYGFSPINPMVETLKAKKAELGQRRAGIENGLKQGQMQFAGLSGALDIIDGLLQNWE